VPTVRPAAADPASSADRAKWPASLLGRGIAAARRPDGCRRGRWGAAPDAEPVVRRPAAAERGRPRRHDRAAVPQCCRAR
jgi:hypothetical protein